MVLVMGVERMESGCEQALSYLHAQDGARVCGSR